MQNNKLDTKPPPYSSSVEMFLYLYIYLFCDIYHICRISMQQTTNLRHVTEAAHLAVPRRATH